MQLLMGTTAASKLPLLLTQTMNSTFFHGPSQLWGRAYQWSGTESSREYRTKAILPCSTLTLPLQMSCQIKECSMAD